MQLNRARPAAEGRPGNGPDSRPSRRQGNRRFRGLTCANCRARKVRCEGSQPTCKTCEVYHDDCQYDKAPPMSQVMAMAERLQEAEKTIALLRSGTSTEDTASPPEAESAHQIMRESPQPTTPDPGPGYELPAATEPVEASTLAVPPGSHPPYRLHRLQGDRPREPSLQDTTTELSYDEEGKICYYGPTSAVHDPPELDSPETRGSASESAQPARSDESVRAFLASQTAEASLWEEFALGNAAAQTGIPRQTMANLLQLHWTWVSPMFMWVYRPAFMRDMTSGGRYYSEFLLTVLCAHSAKYEDGPHAELLLSRARSLLGAAILQPSSVPTVQALLQLSAREVAHGALSQGWLYSGMAFRMAGDLGLQHSGPEISRLKGLSPVDLEVRRRLFWSCYFWDKCTSLYTGRLPVLTDLPSHPTLDLLDTSADSETWSPYYGDSTRLTKLAPGRYPPMKSYTVTCFANSCRLAIIISDVITQLYSRRSRPISETVLREIKTRLDEWRAKSPAFLRYDPNHLPDICPPPHHVSQNLLYYTTIILAHRPFWSSTAYYKVCIDAAQSTEKLLLLLEKTFGFENISYLMGYCIYTSASVILEDAKKGNPAAHTTMHTYLRALNTGTKRVPILERSLNIIIKGLKPAPPPDDVRYGNDNGETGSMLNRYIPAFPHFDPVMDGDFDMEAALEGSFVNTPALLDCFPELQFDLGDLLPASQM